MIEEIATQGTTEREQPIGGVRWVPRLPSEGRPGRTLQQCWRIWTYENGNLASYRDEWRDVPVVADGV